MWRSQCLYRDGDYRSATWPWPRKAIMRLKHNKATKVVRLPAELFKHALAPKQTTIECMTVVWNFLFCSIHYNGNLVIRVRCREISLPNIAFKVLSSILCERLNQPTGLIQSNSQMIRYSQFPKTWKRRIKGKWTHTVFSLILMPHSRARKRVAYMPRCLNLVFPQQLIRLY